LDPWVSWIEPLNKIELASIMPMMDVGVMTVRNVPALFAASPNKFFDYVASGLPVLMNYPGWLEDLIHQYDCGLSVQPDDPQAMAQAMISLRDDAAMRARMGRNARDLAEAEFSRDDLARQFVQVMEVTYAECEGAPRTVVVAP
jgi:glycosyltransferase involved in cell wall biosynthesis